MNVGAADPLLRVLSGPLETLILERLPDGALRTVGEAPEWSRAVLGEALADPVAVFPFLAPFLEEAEEVWAAAGDGSRRSGLWTQVGPDERLLHLSARAVKRGELRLLLVSRDEDAYRDHQMLAQKGRDSALAMERLRKEIQKKEILVHCIVHDLAVPINTLTGILGLLDEAGPRLPADLARLVGSASRAAERQAALVREILDAFSAEQEELAHVERSPERAPDAVSAAGAARELLESQARAHEVSLRIAAPPRVDWRVVAERSRLERVFINLLENAVRFSPRGGTVTLAFSVTGDQVVATVDDEGPGVPEELRPHLFQRFVQGRGRMGRTGLGLYFCAMMARRWGGSIAYSTAPGGGARFELRLSRPRPGVVGLGQPLVDSRQ